MSEPSRDDLDVVVEEVVDHVAIVSAVAHSRRRVDAHDAGDRRPIEGGAQHERGAHALADDDDPAPTRAVSRSKPSATSPDQSLHRVPSISSTVVPWPGSRGSSTSYPAPANASAMLRTEAGVPVNPCTTSTPLGEPATCVHRFAAGHHGAPVLRFFVFYIDPMSTSRSALDPSVRFCDTQDWWRGLLQTCDRTGSGVAPASPNRAASASNS